MGTACAADCDGMQGKVREDSREGRKQLSWEGAAPGGSDAMGLNSGFSGREMEMGNDAAFESRG